MGAPYSPSVVVGIDGSRAALDAALWAVDEAVSRDIPLRLVYAIDSTDNSHTTRRARRASWRSCLFAMRAPPSSPPRSRSRSRWRYCRATQPVR